MVPPRRRSLRLQGYDYSQPGAYFITMCTQDSLCYLGEVIGDEFRPSQVGELAIKSWEWLPGKYPYVELDAWVLMPNHFHGILVICDEASSSIRRGGSRAAPTGQGRDSCRGRWSVFDLPSLVACGSRRSSIAGMA
jgi:hypothetical protein